MWHTFHKLLWLKYFQMPYPKCYVTQFSVIPTPFVNFVTHEREVESAVIASFLIVQYSLVIHSNTKDDLLFSTSCVVAWQSMLEDHRHYWGLLFQSASPVTIIYCNKEKKTNIMNMCAWSIVLASHQCTHVLHGQHGKKHTQNYWTYCLFLDIFCQKCHFALTRI